MSLFPQLTQIAKQPGNERPMLQQEMNYQKIYNEEREYIAKALVRAWQKEEKRIVISGGVFDIATRMHQEYAHALKSLGDKLVMMVSTDERVISSKGKETIIDWENRAALLAHNPSIDLIVPKGKGQTNLDFLQEYKPNRITYSLTSGEREFTELEGILSNFPSRVTEQGRIAMEIKDQECQVVVFHDELSQEGVRPGETIQEYLERCRQFCRDYNANKWEDENNVSGSMIKQRVIKQYLKNQGK